MKSLDSSKRAMIDWTMGESKCEEEEVIREARRGIISYRMN